MHIASPAHGLYLYVDSTRSSSKGIIDLSHVKHRHDTVIVPAIVSKRTAIIAGEKDNVEVGDVDRRFVSEGEAWVRHDRQNSCIWSRYIDEGGIKDLDEGWGRVCRIKTHERVVCTPLSVVCTHDIVFEGVKVLRLLTHSSCEPR